MKASFIFYIVLVFFAGVCWISCTRQGSSSFVSCRCLKGMVSRSYGMGFYADTAATLYRDSCLALQVRDTLDTCIVQVGAY